MNKIIESITTGLRIEINQLSSDISNYKKSLKSQEQYLETKREALKLLENLCIHTNEVKNDILGSFRTNKKDD